MRVTWDLIVASTGIGVRLTSHERASWRTGSPCVLYASSAKGSAVNSSDRPDSIGKIMSDIRTLGQGLTATRGRLPVTPGARDAKGVTIRDALLELQLVIADFLAV